MLTRRLVDEGEYDHASRVVKDAINIEMTDDVDESEEEEEDVSDDEGCIVLSDDEDDEEDDEESEDEAVEESSGTTAAASLLSKREVEASTLPTPRHNPFLRAKRSSAKATSEPLTTNKKWYAEKEKFRRLANEKAISFQAREVGCESVEVFNTILNVVEINRARDAALKQEAKHKQQEQMVIEEESRLERERKFREDMFLVQDDDSEGEMDDEAEMNKAVTLETVMKNSARGEYDIDIDDFSSEDEDEDEEGQGEEERLAAALREEEAMLERLRQQEEEEESSAALTLQQQSQRSLKEDKLAAEDDSDDDSEVKMKSRVALISEEGLVDSDNEDGVDPSAAKRERESHKKKKEKKESKSLSYPEMIRLEEQLARQRKNAGGGFLEDEAEEDEEEGGQAGLGDFGFKFTKNEYDDEREAMKFRKGDLSHIVNDEDADSGDEDEGHRRRLEAEEKEEKERTKAIVSGLARGHTGRHEDALTTSPRKGFTPRRRWSQRWGRSSHY